jgi:hypothetical protein
MRDVLKSPYMANVDEIPQPRPPIDGLTLLVVLSTASPDGQELYFVRYQDWATWCTSIWLR